VAQKSQSWCLARLQKYDSRKEAQKAQKQTGQSSSENAFVYPDFLRLFAATVHFGLLYHAWPDRCDPNDIPMNPATLDDVVQTCPMYGHRHYGENVSELQNFARGAA
jgi:hypothetical protein